MAGACTVCCVTARTDVGTTARTDVGTTARTGVGMAVHGAAPYYSVDRMTLPHTIVPTNLSIDVVADTKAERCRKAKGYNALTLTTQLP